VSNRVLVTGLTQYTFNPTELRVDTRNTLSLELDAYQPLGGERGFLHVDAQASRNFGFGWHELRALLRATGEFGAVLFTDEIPLDDHLRIGFGLEKYTRQMASTRLELRWSLVRDKIKVGPFSDQGVWRKLASDDPRQPVELAGSSGGGVYLFILDELQVDAFYGLGWSTDGFTRTGFNLQIKEAF